MQSNLTSNGRNSNQEPMRTITLELNNASNDKKSVILCSSAARLITDHYKNSLLTDSENCVMLPNVHFDSLDALNAFVKACPTRLHVVAIMPLSSANLLEQTTKAVKLLTPTFGMESIVEEIPAQPLAGGANFTLPDYYLGSNAEVMITIQPMTKIMVVLTFGYYQTDRLVP